MTKNRSKPDMLLRKGAEARVASAPLAETSTQTAGEQLHELSVHQFELEILRKEQVALGESRDHYPAMNSHSRVSSSYGFCSEKGEV